ncbi:CDPK-related kinase 4-like [Ipomoea triloba]|uniref:CDPK-related kinase 4-like n=1 Tax=Ipomoea triloba TaxID=35885 RepID=UPI00125DEE2C|nr:CDPK-related kinase 4-like [Ipomoea triloba]
MANLCLRLRGAQHAALSTSESPIPRENDGGEGGRRGPGVNFGYENDFSSHFQLKKKKLGRGAFGYTYKAIGLRGELKNQFVDVNIIPKTKIITPFDFKYVQREVNILGGLSAHQNQIQFHKAFEDEEYVFIVMEYCKGGGLWESIHSRGGRYKEEDAKRVIVQILNFAAHIHLQGVVHRDLKPENILFAKESEDATVKVIGFGLSDYIQPGKRLNAYAGTSPYIAPEVLDESYGVSADMWSIGVITFILLSGTFPFGGHSIFDSILHSEPNFQGEAWSTISNKGKDFVLKLLIKDHRRRMTAAEALSDPWLRSQKPDIPLDISIYKLLNSYMLNKPLRRATIRALSMALIPTRRQLTYLNAQFQLLKPTNGYVSIDNFGMALMKYMSDAMWKAKVLDIIHQMPKEEIIMDFEEFCAAAISPLLLKAIGNQDYIVTEAYKHHFEQWNRVITVEDISEEQNLETSVWKWVRSDGKLSLFGYKKILQNTSPYLL